jgi:acyl carrier protein
MSGRSQSVVVEKLRQIFSESLGLELTGDEANLISGGLLDSLGLVELLLRIELEFGVTPDFESLEIEDFESLAAIERLIVKSQPDKDGFGDGLTVVDGTG